jgi:lysyl-tRNA synthetase, class II
VTGPTSAAPAASDDPATSDADAEADAQLPEQLRIRRVKYERLVDDPQHAPFPATVPRTHSLAEVRAAFPDLPADTQTGTQVGVTGRVIFARNTGRLCFATIREDGVELQVMLSAAVVGEESLAAWKADVDLGDIVFVQGEVTSSKRGELSVLAAAWRIAAKALRPLPVAHKTLSDEAQVRYRYLDLIMRTDARAMVHARARVLRSIRESMHRLGYLELETPVLNLVHGGAAARPFGTHLNAFDLDMSLRIATELYLKRAIVGGLPKVYEIGRVFRNEGVDSTHSPEYTLLEAYEAFGDYHTMADLMKRIIFDAAEALEVSEIRAADRSVIELGGEWRWRSIYELVGDVIGEPISPDTGAEELRKHAARHNVAIKEEWEHGDLVLELYEKLVEHTLIQPTFVCDYPAAVRPLARPHREDPRLAEAWDLVIGGVELAPAYSELVDPVEQRRRLQEQSLAAAAGDPEAMELDEDFLRAMEHGMPPMGGLGLGVDRLIMLLTGHWGIRETILFPLLRPT